MSDSWNPAPLLHAIAIRLAVAALGLITLMVIVTIMEYMGNLEKLRRATLEDQAEAVFLELRSGRITSFKKTCRQHPDAYGYRIFDDKNEIIAQVNGELFPDLPRYRSGRPDLSFKHWRTSDPWDDQWFVTTHQTVAGRPLWVTVTMIGDPAGLWSEVLVDEIIEHVIMPAIIVGPPLGLAIFWALYSALQPLSGLAERARSLAREANSGRSLKTLRSEGLPSEAQDLVTAINIVLEKYESVVEQQRQFTANAAHELRTPLAALLLQISCLPPSEAVGRLKSDAGVMCRLVDQLLRLAQAEQLARSDFGLHDLREIARAACEDMAVLATTQGRLLEFDEPPMAVMTSCNAEFIQIAIRNIIENALRAAPVGSIVIVAVTELAEVAVLDRGPGISDAEKTLVFQRYWTNCRRTGEGAGIGLALVQRIMDLHAGAARVEDRDDGGARVTLSFQSGGVHGSTSLRRPSAYCGRSRAIQAFALESSLAERTGEERENPNDEQLHRAESCPGAVEA